MNKCTVYISSQSPGIKNIIFYDNWVVYLSNGNQSGWQRDTSTRYMTFVTGLTATQKILLQFKKIHYRYILYNVYNSNTEFNN
jgi:hypothetical protein